MDHLERALGGDFGHIRWLVNDSDLDPIRGHPRFVALMARLRGPGRDTKG
jgi:hypothetical protein